MYQRPHGKLAHLCTERSWACCITLPRITGHCNARHSVGACLTRSRPQKQPPRPERVSLHLMLLILLAHALMWGEADTAEGLIPICGSCGVRKVRKEGDGILKAALQFTQCPKSWTRLK